MRYRSLSIALVLFTITCSCENKKHGNDVRKSDTAKAVPPTVARGQFEVVEIQSRDTGRRIMITDFSFFGDSVLHGYSSRVKYYFKKYKRNACDPAWYYEHSIKGDDRLRAIKSLGDINGDNRNDSVFVLEPLNVCEEGRSYYFSDTSIPRILTESACCSPDCIFAVGDIDEDGICEVGQFYSECVSRYKQLFVLSLKEGKWEKVGHCTVDVLADGPVWEKRVKKISKGKFKMLEVTGDSVIYKKWITFSF